MRSRSRSRAYAAWMALALCKTFCSSLDWGDWMTVHDLNPEVTMEDIERLNKLRTYYDYFDIGNRYGIDFPTFVRRVELGTWEAYFAS